MPLPQNNIPWPPKEWQPIQTKIDEWAVWWEGDPQKLWNFYHGQGAQTHGGTVQRRGLSGLLQRLFWGRQTQSGAQNRPSRGDLHVPIARDLAATSAELLYSEPPSFETNNKATSDYLDGLIEAGLFTELRLGAETGAALGGRYQRVTWDTSVSDRAFLSTVDADHALPEFKWGRLAAVTFWTVLEVRGNVFIRHVERHELDGNGNGVVFHGLYEGRADNLGMLVPLNEHPATAGLATVINDQAMIEHGVTPGLNVAYIPNALPNIAWRNSPTGKHLGRSDFDGAEPLMDALDETYSAWQRDVRLGKARVFADRMMLEHSGDGDSVFDLDREVFTPLDGLAGSMADTVPIHPQQFAIRVAEHQQTAQDLVRRIIRTARYSSSTFGDDVADTDVTATEVRARQAATMKTRAAKIQLEKPALTHLVRKLMLTDAEVFGVPGLDPDSVTPMFPDIVTVDPAQVAQTIAALSGANAISTQTAVEMAHPDWTPDQVNAEVERIRQAAPLTAPEQWEYPLGAADEQETVDTTTE